METGSDSGGGANNSNGNFQFYAGFQNAFLCPYPPLMTNPRNNKFSITEHFASMFTGGQVANTNNYVGATATPWLNQHQISFPHGLVPASWVQPAPLVRTNHQETRRRVRGNGKSSLSSGFIKGQWTEDEDRHLIRLVKLHGDKKWSLISAEMFGRAGKQCRERWHNHLRPDIKKESWTDEEEKLLVEIHEKVGNRWSQISKRIPGRTENGIKNHWNATKRRQFSRKRVKPLDAAAAAAVAGAFPGNPAAGNKRKPVVLQNYIKYRFFSGLTLGLPAAAENPSIQLLLAGAAAAGGGQLPELPGDNDQDLHDSPPLLAETYDEEINFMQSLFGDSSSSSMANNGSNNQSNNNNNNNNLGSNGKRIMMNEDDEDSWSIYLASDPNLYEIGAVDHQNMTSASSTPSSSSAAANSGGNPPYHGGGIGVHLYWRLSNNNNNNNNSNNNNNNNNITNNGYGNFI